MCHRNFLFRFPSIWGHIEPATWFSLKVGYSKIPWLSMFLTPTFPDTATCLKRYQLIQRIHSDKTQVLHRLRSCAGGRIGCGVSADVVCVCSGHVQICPVCVYFAFIYIYIYIHIHIYKYTNIQIYTFIQYTFIHLYKYTNIHIYIYIYFCFLYIQ